MSKLLSVIIPSYNTERYIIDCTSTMLDPRVFSELEILLINDGSKDKTTALADKLASDYPDVVRHIYKENGGHGSAVNRGINESSGKYIRVIDGDDWVDTEEFVKYVKALSECDEDLVLTSFNRVIEPNAIVETTKIHCDPGIYRFDDIAKNIYESYSLHSSTFKGVLLKQMKSIREKCFYVDQEYISYPLDVIKSVRVLDCCVYQYRIGNNEQSMSLKNMVKNRKMHELVIDDLIDYVHNTKMSSNIESFLVNRIGNMVRRQINVYLVMEDKHAGKHECEMFINKIKYGAPEVYRSIPGRRIKLFKINIGLAYNLLWGKT